MTERESAAEKSRKVSENGEGHQQRLLGELARMSSNELFDRAVKELRKNEYLTSLLADSESMVHYLMEQSQVLKAEIRRLEHNFDRSTQLGEIDLDSALPAEEGNLLKKTRSEYLKNILLKFLTLPRNLIEERRRLVPVMTMLLSLDPEERQKLAEFASTGCAPLENVPSFSWSSYLSISSYWPSST
ncbi:GRIP and coiled-coil domain-containing protein 2 [Cichlidogyrus casuarinus]|uniref:GRIP and coiled-coil domain-containing protein 2 n=1 Tax=Cichlidogyrus casuarinus TaxID=1844966 RepID=A0ABD2QL62_9PLAT